MLGSEFLGWISIHQAVFLACQGRPQSGLGRFGGSKPPDFTPFKPPGLFENQIEPGVQQGSPSKELNKGLSIN